MNIINLQSLRWLVACLAFVLVLPVWAQDEDTEAATSSPSAIYIPLKPAFVVNYGGQGRLKYIKAEMSVRVADSDAANTIRHHMPFIRNNLVLLLSSQTEDSIDTMEGKELLRQAALEEIRKILAAEEEVDGVVDLYFDNFIVQR